jgi:hypothetical protein
VNNPGKSPRNLHNFLRIITLRFSQDCTVFGNGVWKDIKPPFKTAGRKFFEASDEMDAEAVDLIAEFIFIIPRGL